MPTVLRADALRVVIHPDDHDPPHVHVIGDGQTKIILGNSPTEMTVLFSANAKAGEERRAVAAVRANHALLLRRWSELNG